MHFYLFIGTNEFKVGSKLVNSGVYLFCNIQNLCGRIRGSIIFLVLCTSSHSTVYQAFNVEPASGCLVLKIQVGYFCNYCSVGC